MDLKGLLLHSRGHSHGGQTGTDFVVGVIEGELVLSVLFCCLYFAAGSRGGPVNFKGRGGSAFDFLQSPQPEAIVEGFRGRVTEK